MQHKRKQVDLKQLSVMRADMLGRHLEVVKEHFGGDFDVTLINGQSLVDMQLFAVKQAEEGRFAESTARDVFAAFKQLLKWLYSVAELLDRLPRNFDDKSLAIHVSASEPETLPVDKINELLAQSTARTELYILLGLNCGYRQSDIASINPREVDWNAGTISRKRTKTAKKKRTPTVTYKLWPRTLELLMKEGKRTGDRVLLSLNGTPLVNNTLRDNGRTKNRDAIKSAIKRVAKKTKIPFSMDLLRNTSATLLRGNAKYTTLVDLFLGHAPRSMADKHYAAAPVELLAEALDWLAGEFGQSGNQPEKP